MNSILSAEDFTRLANNFYQSKNLSILPERIGLDSELMNYVSTGIQNPLPKFKVAFCWICINPHYWEFAKQMVSGAKQFFLPGHQVDFFLWSDIPKEEKEMKEVIEKNLNPQINKEESLNYLKDLSSFIHSNMTVIPTEAIEWPMPTLMRYHLFLQEEAKLSEYDYVAFCDADMLFVNIVGDEILGKGLTAALHPGYAIDKKLWPPYEPNKNSASFIQRPGKIINDNGKPRFMPMYFAGGFQLGTSKAWFDMCKGVKRLVDEDMAKGYIPIWNDESAFNKYLEKTPEDLVVLSPSYVYPDSLIEEYYTKIWGCNYPPKLITLTKKFSVSAEGGNAVQKMIKGL